VSDVYDFGDLHGIQRLASSRHWNVAWLSVATKLNLTRCALVARPGPAVMSVFGGVASIRVGAGARRKVSP
jgi:hypothetical protein